MQFYPPGYTRYLFSQKSLFAELVKRTFAERYAGTLLSFAWPTLQPLLMLGVYTIAFSIILRDRWTQSGSTEGFAIFVFLGLICHAALAEVLNRAPSLIITNANFVKKINFPLEILPPAYAIVAFVNLAISSFVSVVWVFLLSNATTPNLLGAFLVLLSFIPVLIGVSLILAAIGVFLRDIQQITSIIAQGLLFLSPVFYSLEMAPPGIRWILFLNPLTYVIESLRACLLYQSGPSVSTLLLYLLASSIFMMCCWWCFIRIKPIFADVL